MRLIDSCITQPKAQGPSRTCNESKEEEEEESDATTLLHPSFPVEDFGLGFGDLNFGFRILGFGFQVSGKG